MYQNYNNKLTYNKMYFEIIWIKLIRSIKIILQTEQSVRHAQRKFQLADCLSDCTKDPYEISARVDISDDVNAQWKIYSIPRFESELKEFASKSDIEFEDKSLLIEFISIINHLSMTTFIKKLYSSKSKLCIFFGF